MPNRPQIEINEFFNELADRGIKSLYHSNSLETSISFLRSATLLSREACVTQSLPMSPQWSDSNDQRHNIWSDIFLNLNDQHIVFKGPNKYGPILFQLNAERLRNYLLQNCLTLAITRTQPHNWKDSTTDEEKWQSSFESIFANQKNATNPKFLNGWPDIVVSGTTNYGLPIHLCDSVIIDKHPTIQNYYSQVEAIFQNCLSAHQISVQINPRSCFVSNCKCKASASVPTGNSNDKYATLGWESEYGRIA